MIETTNHMRYEIRLTFFYPDEYYEQFENMYYSSILVKAPSINKFDFFFYQRHHFESQTSQCERKTKDSQTIY